MFRSNDATTTHCYQCCPPHRNEPPSLASETSASLKLGLFCRTRGIFSRGTHVKTHRWPQAGAILPHSRLFFGSAHMSSRTVFVGFFLYAIGQVTGRAFLDRSFPGGVSTVPSRALKYVNLGGCRKLDSGAVEWITAGCTGLRDLAVSGCASVTPEAVDILVATHPTLERLDVAGCIGLGGTVLSFAAQRGSCLRHLDIANIPTVSARVVGEFLSICGRLEYLDVSGLTRVNHSSFRGLGSSHNRSAGSNIRGGGSEGSSLRHVRLEKHAGSGGCLSDQHNEDRGSDSPESDGGAGEQRSFGYGTGGTTLPHLKVARMLRLPNIDNAGIMRFARASPNLEELHLSDSPMVTGACLATVASVCPWLRHLGLDRCTAASDENALAAALQGLPRLEHLALAREGHGRSAGCTAENNGCGRHGPSKLSRRAPFGGTDYLHPDRSRSGGTIPGTPLTGEILLAAASRYCPHLTTLGLEGHQRLTFTVDRLPPGSVPSLTQLRLDSCSSVDDAAPAVILAACPRVCTLSLSGSGVSQEALVRSAAAKLALVEVIPLPPLPILAGLPSRTQTAPLVEEALGSPSLPPSGMSPAAVEASSSLTEGLRGVSSAVCGATHWSVGLEGSREAGSSSVGCSDEAGSSSGDYDHEEKSSSALRDVKASSSVLMKGKDKATPRSAVCNSASARKEERLGKDTAGLRPAKLRGEEGARRSAVGLTPAENSQLKLTADALLSRFEVERLAVKTLARALRCFLARQPRSEILAARTICRAMLRHRFRVYNWFPEQVRRIA